MDRDVDGNWLLCHHYVLREIHHISYICCSGFKLSQESVDSCEIRQLGRVLISILCAKDEKLSHLISTAYFYKWRVKFGGMDAFLMARLKELEDENRRLKKMYAEESVKAEIISEAMAKSGGAISIRLVCQVFKVSEGSYCYQPVLADENQEIADWLLRLTANQRNWGFGLCFLYLRNIKGFGWNHKRVYRIYRVLEQLIGWRGKPAVIRCDNGPEYISEELKIWAKQGG